MPATDNNDTTGQKRTDTGGVRKCYPDEWRGVRYSVTPEHFFGFIGTGWSRVDLDGYGRESESRLSVDVRYQESDPESVRDVDFLIEHADDGGELEAAATVDPAQAVELALSILDEVNGQP